MRALDPVFPACAGMSRVTPRTLFSAAGFPRMRGDEPGLARLIVSLPVFSPHARG